MKKYLLSALFLALHAGLHAQVIRSNMSVSFGAAVDLALWDYRGNFPGIKAFVGFNSSNEVASLLPGGDLSLNISTSITIYNKTLGNSLNLGFQDNQLDWTSSINFGYIGGERKPTRRLRSINNSPFYGIQHDREYAVLVGTNFIVNNYKRNQTVGTLSMTANKLSLAYYNDGGPIFSWIGLSDNFDRYWTGGLALYYHDDIINRQDDPRLNDTISLNRVEFTFDQFTGYASQMFEITKMLGADIQDYDIFTLLPQSQDSIIFSANRVNRKGYDFNASRYELNYSWGPNLNTSIGIIGSLRDVKRETYYALQDIIHIVRREPIHPNKQSNKIILGFDYNSKLWKDE